MGRAPGPSRILGPYDERDGGWSYTEIINGVHKRVRCSGCASKAEAEDFTAGARARLVVRPPMTVREAVEAFVDRTRERRGNTDSEAFARSSLRPLADDCGGRLVARLAPHNLDAYLTSLQQRRIRDKPMNMASIRSYTRAMLRFCTWLHSTSKTPRDVGADWLRQREKRDEPMPWRTAAGARLVNRGKPQLRGLEEVAAYLKSAMALGCPEKYAEADRDRVARERRAAACLPLLCGLASGEVLHLRVGDVDLKAGVGYIRDPDADLVHDGWHVKTANRTGEWEVPDSLRPDLAALVLGRGPDELLFRDRDPHVDEHGKPIRADRPHQRGWLNDLVHEVCEAARVREHNEDEGIPIRVVCPHGLRGTHSTLLRVLMGRKIGDIATALRHADRGATATRHYVGAPERKAALKMVVGGNEASTESSTGVSEDLDRR